MGEALVYVCPTCRFDQRETTNMVCQTCGTDYMTDVVQPLEGAYARGVAAGRAMEHAVEEAALVEERLCDYPGYHLPHQVRRLDMTLVARCPGRKVGE